jgi:hypothetical protein
MDCVEGKTDTFILADCRYFNWLAALLGGTGLKSDNCEKENGRHAATMVRSLVHRSFLDLYRAPPDTF